MSAPFLVIMAGGSGTRFWPKSTSKRPKQLLGFGKNPETLLAQTLRRFDGIVPDTQRMIVTTAALSEPVTREAGPKTLVLGEPQARNTAPCVYWAARAVAERDPNAVMLVMPADHYIPRAQDFSATVRRAIDWATAHEDLVTLGVKPDRPETGYGYLRAGSTLDGGALRVDAFVEKPNLQKAQEFLKAGNYFWNGGMFIWRASVILRAFDEQMPEMKRAWEQAHGKVEEAYPKMTATSIDYGIMEKARNVVTFPLDCGWDDLGSWTSLENLAEKLQARVSGNVVTGGEILPVESEGNIIDAPGKLVALLGVKDLIVVEHGDAILVSRKERAQDIKLVVDQLKKQRPDLT